MLGIGNYLWRLIPANPILLRVLHTGGKRKRDLLFRCAYLGALVFLVVFLLLSSAGDLASANLTALSQQSARIFWWMSYVQLILVALLAPVFTASAITQEKDSQTYDILLSTPLTNGQIVLGSLLSRLFFVIALLISGIPIFSITQIFGGVSIGNIAMSFLIACATAFMTGALAMAIAVFKVGTRRTIFSFYMFILLYLAVPVVIENLGYFQYQWEFSSTGKPTAHISWLAGIHPFLALRVIFGEAGYRPPPLGLVQQHGWPLTWYLSSPQTFYIAFMFSFSFVLVAPSILLLRRLAQSSSTLRTRLLTGLRIVSGDRSRRPRHVWANPIAWREAKTKASATRAVLLRYGFMVLGVAAAVVLLVMSSTAKDAPCYIGLAYNPASGTVTIVNHGDTRPYVIRPNEGFVTPATLITLKTHTDVNGSPVGPEMLRANLVIDADSLRFDPRDPRTIVSMTIRPPETLLPADLTRQFLLGAIMVELAVILLILTQTAASTVTREKEDGTLDLLLATPITSHYYIWGKLRGLVAFVLPLVAVPLLSVAIFIIGDYFREDPLTGRAPTTIYPEALLILPGTLVMVAAFAAILGMQMSLRCKRTVMAVMSSVGIVAGAFGGLWMCGMSATSSGNLSEPGMAVGCFSPFTLMAMLISPADIVDSAFAERARLVADARLLIFFFGWAATVCYGLIVWSMYKSMVRNFDMTIRRQAA